MWHRTRLTKLRKGPVLWAYRKSPLLKYRFKYFLQVNELYKVEEQKLRVSDDNVVGGKSEIQFSSEISWKKEKNEFGDTILIVKIHKDGSVLESRIENAIPKLQSIFGPIISKENSVKYYEVRLFLKQTDWLEEIDLKEEVEINPQRFIQLSKYHKWNYISSPHLLLGGESGSGKSRVLYGLIYKCLRETTKDNIFICDGKGEELYRVSNYLLELPNVGRTSEEIFDYIKDVENIMDRRHHGIEENQSPVFLVVDEFAALRISMNKKEFEDLNNSLKRIILMGRSSNVHLIMALQRAETSVIDGAIRDNFAVRIGMKNLSVENFKMVFGVSKDESILKRKKGQGYISIDGEMEQYEAPWVPLPWDPEESEE